MSGMGRGVTQGERVLTRLSCCDSTNVNAHKRSWQKLRANGGSLRWQKELLGLILGQKW